MLKGEKGGSFPPTNHCYRAFPKGDSTTKNTKGEDEEKEAAKSHGGEYVEALKEKFSSGQSRQKEENRSPRSLSGEKRTKKKERL